MFATRCAVRQARRLGVLPRVGELTTDEASNLLAYFVRGLILDGSLGYDRETADRPLTAFGDGWKTRVEKRRNLLGRYWSVLGCEPHDGGKIAPRPIAPTEVSERHTGGPGAPRVA